MPKVGPRAATPETPRMNRDTMRRAALYNSNPVAPFLKPRLTAPVDEDSLVRRDTRGIPFASSKPGAQQIVERERGFVKSAPPNGESRPGWNVGYINKTSVYSTEPQNLLRYGVSGAKKLQRGRLSKRLENSEWTPKLVAEPSASAAANPMTTPGAWPDHAAQPFGSSARPTELAAGPHKRLNQSWYARETSVADAPALVPTHGMTNSRYGQMSVTLPASSMAIDRPPVEPPLRARDRLERTVAREEDTEARFELLAAAERRRRFMATQRAESGILHEGLGPEARLKAQRLADRELAKRRCGGGGKATKKASGAGGADAGPGLESSSEPRRGAKAASSSSSGGSSGQRVVIPNGERRRPRYCGGLTVCVEARGELDLGEAVRRAASSELQKTKDKWALVGRFHAKWFQSCKDKANFSYDGLVESMAAAAQGNLDSACVTREQFVNAAMLRLRDIQLANRLFAALDAPATGALPWLTALLPLLMLAAAQTGSGQADVLRSGLELAERASPPLTMAAVLEVLCCCSATRMEKLEVQSKAGAGFEFALRASAAAAELGGTVAAASGIGNERLNSSQARDRAMLDTYGGSAGSGLTPALVIDVLSEYPELAQDLNQQMAARFAAAGRNMPSLAVVDSEATAKARREFGKAHGTGAGGADDLEAEFGKNSIGSKGSGGFGNPNGATSAAKFNNSVGSSTSESWVDDGVKAGDRRKNSFLFPSFDDLDSEDGDVGMEA